MKYYRLTLLLFLFITYTCFAQDQWITTDWSNNQYTSFENLDPDASPGELILLNDPSNMVHAFTPTDLQGIWDLKVYNDKLYIAASTDPFAEDGGEILSFDYAADTFQQEYNVMDKGLIQFRLLNNKLYVPGTGSLENYGWGNFYVYDGNSWIQKSTIPEAMNVYDIIVYQEALYASTSTNSDFGAKIYKSTDEGETWTENFSIQGSETEQRTFYMMGIYQDKLYVQGDNVGPEGNVLYLFDGNIWTLLPFSPMVSSIGRLQQYNDNFYYMNGPYLNIYDNTEWQSINLPFSGWVDDPQNIAKRIQKSLGFYKNEFYSGGEEGQLYKSETATIWDPISLLGNTHEEIESLEVYHGRLYVGVNDTTSTGKVYVSGAVPSGILISEKYNFEKLISAGTINWDILLPTGESSVRFRIRTASTQAGLEMQYFTGIDGTQLSFYDSTGQSLHESLFDKNWIQYKVYMTSVNEAYTPILEQVTISADTYTGISSNKTELVELEIFPNPCTESVNLKFQINDPGDESEHIVICDLYDISGVRIKQLINENKMPCTHFEKIDMSDVPAGIYFCTLKTKNGIQTRKIIKL